MSCFRGLSPFGTARRRGGVGTAAGVGGGVRDLAAVPLPLWLGWRQVVRDRGGNGMAAVLVAAFIGMAVEGLVIDSDHWRHFYIIMAMIWGMALAQPSFRRRSRP